MGGNGGKSIYDNILEIQCHIGGPKAKIAKSMILRNTRNTGKSVIRLFHVILTV